MKVNAGVGGLSRPVEVTVKTRGVNGKTFKNFEIKIGSVSSVHTVGTNRPARSFGNPNGLVLTIG